MPFSQRRLAPPSFFSPKGILQPKGHGCAASCALRAGLRGAGERCACCAACRTQRGRPCPVVVAALCWARAGLVPSSRRPLLCKARCTTRLLGACTLFPPVLGLHLRLSALRLSALRLPTRLGSSYLQRSSVLIDACWLGQGQSAFLQQARPLLLPLPPDSHAAEAAAAASAVPLLLPPLPADAALRICMRQLPLLGAAQPSALLRALCPPATAVPLAPFWRPYLQAAHLTGGVYLKPTKPQALVQYLNVRGAGAIACGLQATPAAPRAEGVATQSHSVLPCSPAAQPRRPGCVYTRQSPPLAGNLGVPSANSPPAVVGVCRARDRVHGGSTPQPLLCTLGCPAAVGLCA